jgi:hypothetical protein
VLDVGRLEMVAGVDHALLARFVRLIRGQRHDVNSTVFTVRAADRRAIACLLDCTVDRVADELDMLGVHRRP